MPRQQSQSTSLLTSKYVRPTLEYASSAWDPHTRKNIDKLEQVQRYAATSKFSRSASVTNILQDLKWPSLQQRRQQSRLTMMYKISNQLVDIDSSCHFTVAQSNAGGHSARILQRSCIAVVYANSFFPQTIRDWNQLPTNPLHYRTVDSFKSYLHSDLASKSSSSHPDV